MIDLNELAKESQKIAEKRAMHGLESDTMTCLKHCAGEVVEATELVGGYNWGGNPPVNDLPYELADIIICVLIAAANEKIDIEKAISEKMVINKIRADGGGDNL